MVEEVLIWAAEKLSNNSKAGILDYGYWSTNDTTDKSSKAMAE